MATITIIDDDMEIAEHAAAILKKDGHQVTSIHTTENATKVLVENTPDLLILDVMFPDNPAAGFDLAREIRRTETIKDLPIILLTSVNQQFPMDFSFGDIDQEWMPVQDFIEKPVTADSLLTAVRKMLHQ